MNYSKDKIQELINIIIDIRDYELPYNYYNDLNDIIDILKKYEEGI